jgi:hypothetical protein
MKKKYRFNIPDNQISNETRSTYVILRLDKTNNLFDYNKTNLAINSLETEFYYYLIALCLPQGYRKDGNDVNEEYCEDDDYKTLIIDINNKIGDYLNFLDAEFDIFTLRTNQDESEKDRWIWLKVIPIFFLFLQVIFVLFRSCIKDCIIKIRIKKKNDDKNKIGYEFDDSSDIDDDKNSYIKDNDIIDTYNDDNKLKMFFKIMNCFCFHENGNELFDFSLASTKYNNDSGLSNIRGIIGLSIFFMIFGWTFVILYNCPIKIYSIYHIKIFFSTVLSFFVSIGVRYSPRIVISCSGYILIYKYLSYLDRNYINKSISIFWTSLRFVLYQSHKYFLFILILLIERFSLYHFINLVRRDGETPLWKYYQIYIAENPSSPFQFFLSLIMIRNFFINIEEEQRKNNNLLHYFWLPFNEILFFIFGVILITIGYKKKLRIDNFILILIPLLLILKTAYSYLIPLYFKIKEKNDDSYKFPLKEYLPILYYVFYNYGRFMINPIFNLPYFLIGMFFGLMNYAIQKGINDLSESYTGSHFSSLHDKSNADNKTDNIELSQEDSDADNLERNSKEQKNAKENKKEFEYSEEVTEMPFLINPILFIQWHRRHKHLIILPFIFLAIFIFFLLINLFYTYDDELNNIVNIFINIIYRIDIEFVVLFVQWGAFIIFLIGDNFAGNFLGHISWTMLTKPYFSFILIINTVILFIFYQSETMVEINYTNIFLYSCIGGVLTFIFTILFYICFELPYKRLIHLIYSYKDNNGKDLDDNDSNNDYDSKNNECNEDDEDEKNNLIKMKNE